MRSPIVADCRRHTRRPVTTGQGSRDPAPILADPGRHLRRLKAWAPKLGGTHYPLQWNHHSVNCPSCARDTHGARHPTPLCQDGRRRRAGGQHGSALRRRSHSQSRGTLRCYRLNPGSNSDNWAWRTSGARGITPTSSAFTQAHGVARLRRAFICGKSSHFGDVLVYLLSSPAPSFRGPYRAERVAGCPTWRRVSPAIHTLSTSTHISSDHATRAIRVGMRLSIFGDAPFSSCCGGRGIERAGHWLLHGPILSMRR